MASLLTASPSLVATNASVADWDDSPITPRVRFDHECVLIPDPAPISRMPRLVTKSYSLPLWKRKRDPSLVSDLEDDPLEDQQVVFKVPVPRITTKARSPSHGRLTHQPLASCLVHTDSSFSSASPVARPTRPRCASLPAPVHSDVITVPLRSCCTQCYPSMENCMKEGEHWEVHFSRGALRRKSVSDTHAPVHSRHCLRNAMPGFDSIVAVDEIEQRRRSTDVDALASFAVELPAAVSCIDASSGLEEVPLRRVLSDPDAVHSTLSRPLPDFQLRCVPQPVMILEEDDHWLSPRRAPIPSPLASWTNLPSTLSMGAVQPAISDKLSSDTPPITRASPGQFTLSLESVFSSFPINVTPPTIRLHKAPPSAYPSKGGPERAFSDSPASSPSSSPNVAHVRSPSTPMYVPRKRSFMQLSEGIFRASTSVLKGITGMGGMPMSA